MFDLQSPGAQHALGHTFIEQMTGRKYAVLRIGKDAYTKHQLVTQIGSGNFRSARIISDVAARLELNSVKEIYNVSPYALASEGVGTVTLFVLMALFQAKGLDPYKWYFGGTGKDKLDEGVTFMTIKARATRRDRAAEKDAKAQVKRAARKKVATETKAFLNGKSGKTTNGRTLDLDEALERAVANG